MGGATKKAKRAAGPVCRCKTGPFVVATWRRERLVSVVRVHWSGRDHCELLAEPQPLSDWQD